MSTGVNDAIQKARDAGLLGIDRNEDLRQIPTSEFAQFVADVNAIVEVMGKHIG